MEIEEKLKRKRDRDHEILAKRFEKHSKNKGVGGNSGHGVDDDNQESSGGNQHKILPFVLRILCFLLSFTHCNLFAIAKFEKSTLFPCLNEFPSA